MPGLGHVRPRFRPIAPPLIKASSHAVLRPITGSKPTTWRVIASRFGTASPKMIRINRRVRRIETEPNGDPVSASTVQAVMNTLAADLARLFKDREVIRRELPTDAQHLGDRRGLSLLDAAQRTVDSQADVAVFPVPSVQTVHLGLAARDVISGSTVRVLFVDEALAGEFVQVIAGGPHREVQGSCDRPEMVSREADEMIVDPPADRVLQSHHEGQSDREGRRLPWKSRADPR